MTKTIVPPILFLLAICGLTALYYTYAVAASWSRGLWFVLSAATTLVVAPVPMWYTSSADERPPVITGVVGTIAAWLGCVFLMWMFLQVTWMGYNRRAQKNNSEQQGQLRVDYRHSAEAEANIRAAASHHEADI
jgi:hypothetical protein